MLSLRETIEKDFNNALKKKDESVSILRLLKTAIVNAEIAKMRQKLIDDDVMAVVSSEIKKLKDALIDFERGKREDLISKTKKEIEILSKYMPEQLSDEEVRNIVREKKKELGIDSKTGFGKLMSEVMKICKGKADGNMVKRIVEETLDNQK